MSDLDHQQLVAARNAMASALSDLADKAEAGASEEATAAVVEARRVLAEYGERKGFVLPDAPVRSVLEIPWDSVKNFLMVFWPICAVAVVTVVAAYGLVYWSNADPMCDNRLYRMLHRSECAWAGERASSSR
ncbi:hypothetical protein [Burkholderia sp. Tr-20390]|uniref:hypothetical protein n=1 Tax=Burkholderia sp. Tr-20390 TaxID=2703904 RepID=UPI00197E6C20|nr:hypothetical protein [Burkholderia sp. Tr-20390]MBN3729449.1 hypothetical protein [Burkholderia sp. Tr-20390]